MISYTAIKLCSPIFVSFELTYICNNNCEYCYNYVRHSKKPNFYEATLEEKEIALEDIRDAGVFVINFTGGEPTLSPDLFKLISYSKELGLITTMNTNARLITDEKAKKLKNFGLDGALVSLSGSNAYNHDRQTKVNGSWFETIRGIKALQKFDIPLTVNFTITRKNYRDLENVAQLSKSIGANFSIGRFVPYPQQENYVEFELSNDEIKTILESVKRITNHEINVDFEIPIPPCAVQGEDYSHLFRFSQCYAGVTFCVISPDLSVRACPISNNFIGNLHSHTLKEIWQSEKMDLWRKTSSFPKNCVSCPCFPVCRGGCRQAAIFHSGDISANDPLARPPCKNLKESLNYKVKPLIPFQAIPEYNKKFISRKENFGATIFFEDCSYIFLIGDVSCDLWNLIDGKRNISDILDSISSKYEEDRKKMKKDFMDFFTQLLSLDAIRLKNEN